MKSFIKPLVLIFLFTFSTTALCQDWYRGTGEVMLSKDSEISLEDARRKAFDRAIGSALKNASFEVVGVSSGGKSETIGGEFYDNFIQFTRTRSKGHILDIDTLYDDSKRIEILGGDPVLVYNVEIKAKIKIEKLTADPEFILQLELNQSTFKNGESMTMNLEASKDCYITVLNLYSNDSLLVIFPNQIMSNNTLSGGKSVSIPPRNAYWDLPVGLMPGKKVDSEAILTIATKKNIPFEMKKYLDRDGLMAQSDALLAINKWLADIDADQRTEAWAIYRIVE